MTGSARDGSQDKPTRTRNKTATEYDRDDPNRRSFCQALKIAAIYFVAGALWILLTDRLAEAIFEDRSLLAQASLYKGWLFVFLSALLIFLLVYPSFVKILKTKQKLKLLNEDLEKEQTLLHSLLNSIPDLIYYKDLDRRYIGCNNAFEEFCARSEGEIIGCTDEEIFSPQTAEAARTSDFEVLFSNNPQRVSGHVSYPDGRSFYMEILKTPYCDQEGRIIGLIGIGRDLSERRKREEEIQYLNHHDTLTGVKNRAFLIEEEARLDRPDQLPLSIIVGDINGLKLINDSLGHQEGDRLLIEAGEILMSCSRDGDTVARTGGDEFCVLLPRTNEVDAQIILDCITNLVETRMKQPDDEEFHTSISLGFATRISMDQPISKILSLAEEKMYQRKLLEYKSLHSSIISSIMTTMFEKSNETEAHARRLAEMSKKLGRLLSLSDSDLDALELVATLHDIGKISIDRKILTKPGPLDEDEWFEMKKHPAVGFRITQASPELRHISNYILHHHERWDGQGYPQGLAGEEIGRASCRERV